MTRYVSDEKELINFWDYKKNKIKPEEAKVASRNKYFWLCENGHSYEQDVYSKLNGSGCPYCTRRKAIKGVNDFATLHPEMLNEWDYEKNDKLGIKPDELLVGSQKAVYWICSKGHSFKRSAYDRLNGKSNCPYCTNRKLLKGYNDLATTNPELLEEWNYEKNDKLGIKPDEITSGGRTKVWWKCSKGHEWDSIIRSRITGSGCPYCSNNLVLKGYNDLATTNPDVLKEWDYEKNKTYNPYNISHGSDKKVWWKCEKGHEYYVSVAQKIRQNIKCPICANQVVLKGYNDFATKHPQLLKEWDYEKNDIIGITPDNVSNGSSLKVWWKCENNHSYKATISTKINQSTGCPYCTNKTVLSGFNDIATTNPELLIEWDYEKNDKLGIKPNKITKGYGKKVWWKCEKGHSYDSIVNNRIKGDSCPYCSGHRVMNGFNDIATTNPELKKEWDFDKNNKLGFYMENYTKGNVTKVWWKCEKGHSYQATINSKTSPKRTNCPYCSGQKLLKGFNDVETTNSELLKEWDYEKNEIKPDEITNGTHKKIWWKCSKGHSYQATIPNRRKGTNCPYCSGNKILIGYNDVATTHPEILEQWDYERNNAMGITPNNVSKSYSKKVWWKCEKGHSYQREIYNQRNGYAKCPICRKEKKQKQL